jgi:hypothetical protein
MPLDQIKKEQIDSTPIDREYSSQALMIADQANQYLNYIYFDGSSHWQYLGLVSGDINVDYRLISSVTVLAGFEMIQRSTATISFDYLGGYIHGNAVPIPASEIFYDFTSGIRGVVCKMRHSSGTVPILPVQSKVIAGYHAVNVVNYYTFELINREVGSEQVWVTIGQSST